MAEHPAAVAFRFPSGRYVAGHSPVAWPPDPWRVLAALTDVAATDPTLSDLRAETRRLVLRVAAAGPPRIGLPEHVVSDDTYHWVPRSVATPTSRLWDDRVAGPRRTFVAVNPDSPVQYTWDTLLLDDTDRALLHELVSRIPHLGQSESVVHADATEPERPSGAGQQLAPSTSGTLPLRWIDPRHVGRLFIDDTVEPGWEFGGNRRQSITAPVVYGPVRTVGAPRIVTPADGDRPGPAPTADAVPVRHVGNVHGDGRQLGWLLFDTVPAGWVEPFGMVPKTLQMVRWTRPATIWVSTEPLRKPARPTLAALHAATAAGDQTVDGPLAWTYLTDPRRHRPTHLPADATVTRLVRQRNGQVAGARGAGVRETHLQVIFDRAVSGPIVIDGVLFTQQTAGRPTDG